MVETKVSQIIIDIDVEKKGIIKISLPEELNPAEVIMVFNSVSNSLLSKLKIETIGKIEIPKKNILKVVGNVN